MSELLTIPLQTGLTQNLAGLYTYKLFNRAGTKLGEIQGMVKAPHLTLKRNDISEFSFNVDIQQIHIWAAQQQIDITTIVDTGKNYIVVTRLVNNDQVPIFAGVIASAAHKLEDLGGDIAFKCFGFGWELKYRFAEGILRYDQVDAGAIANDLVARSQSMPNAEENIIAGITQPTQKRDRGYQDKNIYDAIKQLSEVIGGFDYEFKMNTQSEKQFNVYTSLGQTRPQVVFTYPSNIKSIGVDEDTTQIANRVIASSTVDSEDGSQEDLTAESEDLQSQQLYGLRQAFVSFQNITNLSTLQNHADSYIPTYKKPIVVLSISIQSNLSPRVFEHYNLGDTIYCQITNYDLYTKYKGYYRIDQIDFSLDENETETIDLKVSNVG